MQSNHPKLIGYAPNGTCELNSVQEVAEFICREGVHGDLTIRTRTGDFFLSTFGTFIDRIADMSIDRNCWKFLCPCKWNRKVLCVTSRCNGGK